MEAPSKGGLPRTKAAQGQPQPIIPAPVAPVTGHVLLDMEEAGVPGQASEVALGVRTAAVSSPAGASTQTSSTQASQDRASSAAGFSPAALAADGFEAVDLQENRAAHCVGSDDPGGGGGVEQQRQPFAAAEVSQAAQRPVAGHDDGKVNGSGRSVADDDTGSEKGFSAELESLRYCSRRVYTSPRPAPTSVLLLEWLAIGNVMISRQVCALITPSIGGGRASAGARVRM